MGFLGHLVEDLFHDWRRRRRGYSGHYDPHHYDPHHDPHHYDPHHYDPHYDPRYVQGQAPYVAQQACPSCGAAVAPGAPFCGQCGTALGRAPAAATVCGSCGQPAAPGARFCSSCGAGLG